MARARRQPDVHWADTSVQHRARSGARDRAGGPWSYRAGAGAGSLPCADSRSRLCVPAGSLEGASTLARMQTMVSRSASSAPMTRTRTAQTPSCSEPPRTKQLLFSPITPSDSPWMRIGVSRRARRVSRPRPRSVPGRDSAAAAPRHECPGAPRSPSRTPVPGAPFPGHLPLFDGLDHQSVRGEAFEGARPPGRPVSFLPAGGEAPELRLSGQPARHDSEGYP